MLCPTRNRSRLSLSRPVLAEGKSAQKQQRSLEKDRAYSLEAAIVRLMKTRKALQQTQLEVEVMATSNMFFVVTPELVQLCLDNVIKRDYVERDETDPGLLVYVP